MGKVSITQLQPCTDPRDVATHLSTSIPPFPPFPRYYHVTIDVSKRLLSSFIVTYLEHLPSFPRSLPPPTHPAIPSSSKSWTESRKPQVRVSRSRPLDIPRTLLFTKPPRSSRSFQPHKPNLWSSLISSLRPGKSPTANCFFLLQQEPNLEDIESLALFPPSPRQIVPIAPSTNNSHHTVATHKGPAPSLTSTPRPISRSSSGLTTTHFIPTTDLTCSPGSIP